MRREEAHARLQALGFRRRDALTLIEHFEDADRRGKHGHGFSRLEWLESVEGLEYDPAARPVAEERRDGYERWNGNRAIGYVALRDVVESQVEAPPTPARLVVVRDCFPTGMLGHYVRRLCDAGLVGVLTATSPARLAHPDGGPPITGTNPIAIGIPSSDGRPLVADVSMGRVTYGDVLTGAADPDELVPFGGEQAHKAFALALGLQLLVDSLTGGEGHGAVLIVARPEADPVPALRAAAGSVRLPGDR
jgi:LDH2 family malate/lactate/ureidoglycolate dehydrogenase